jgi:hypothetical protein
MKAIKQIYHNNSGTSFFWKKQNDIVTDKVQLIFRETGFYFSRLELQQFKGCIEDSYLTNQSCDNCDLRNSCHKFLLRTPCAQIDLAVSMSELTAVKDLVEGTLFKISMIDYLNGEGMN